MGHTYPKVERPRGRPPGGGPTISPDTALEKACFAGGRTWEEWSPKKLSHGSKVNGRVSRRGRIHFPSHPPLKQRTHWPSPTPPGCHSGVIFFLEPVDRRFRVFLQKEWNTLSFVCLFVFLDSFTLSFHWYLEKGSSDSVDRGGRPLTLSSRNKTTSLYSE